MTIGTNISLIKPELALNRNHPNTTVAQALNDFILSATQGLAGKTSLAICTAYFDLGGYAQLEHSLSQVSKVRLLIGAEPYPPTLRPRSLAADSSRSSHQENQDLRTAIDENKQSLYWGRDLLEFTPETLRTIHHLTAWLKSEKVEVRRLESRFLHAKAFIVEQSSHGVVAGSSNLTKAGLTRNIELNLGNYTPSIVAEVAGFFNELWEQAEDYDLAAVFEQDEPHPYLIYLRMLWERYKSELEKEDNLTPSLTQFQQHGLFRAQRIIEKYGGVLIADEVGLGKTYIAGEIIRQIIDNKQRALVVAPAVLRDGMWKGFLREQDFGRLSVELVSYDEVTTHMSNKNSESFNPGEYALIVADEAHYLRNLSTKRVEAFSELLGFGGQKKLVLLTATPVNNTLMDLHNLLNQILRAGGHGDSALSGLGIFSLQERFYSAQAMDVDSLEPRYLFDVLDELCVRRMRQFIKKHYQGDTYQVDDSVEHIKFPKPNVKALRYNIDSLLPDFFDEFEYALDADNTLNEQQDQRVLTFARYRPSFYFKSKTDEPALEQNEILLVGLMRSLLLKRFESSPHAFAISCERMMKSNQVFLSRLRQGLVISKKLVADLIDTSSEDGEALEQEDYEELEKFQQNSLFQRETDEASRYDVELLGSHVEQDIRILEGFARRAREITQEKDPTLHQLVDCLENIVEQADSAKTQNQSTDSRKVLIFSYYADTVNWIYEFLVTKAAESNSSLACYDDRIAKLTGGNNSTEKDKILKGFAPRTAGKGMNCDDLFDIVVATDVLAEGVNLQQAQHIINYDLPWNPMRLVQRHGRIDRIGSLHEEVYLYCIMPDTRLDDLLRLEKRLRLKIGQANASVGVGEILPGQDEASERIFSDTKEELEKIIQGNAELLEKAGSGTSALSGEEFRQDLREAMADGKGQEIEELPYRSGTGMALVEIDKGESASEPGFVFCAKVGDSPNVQYRFVTLQAAQQTSLGQDSSEATTQIEIEADTLECLFRARAVSGWAAEAIPQNLAANPNHPVFQAWKIARNHIAREWNKLADKRAVEPKVQPVLKRAGQLLLENPPDGVDKETIDNAISAIQAPLLKFERQEISRIMKQAGDDKNRATRGILDVVKQLGLQPFEAPKPNPAISVDNVHLVCWLALV